MIENAFTLDATAPSVTSISEKAFIGATFDIIGSNLNVVEKILLEGRELAVELATSDKLTCLIPTDFEVNGNAKIEFVYFGGKMQTSVGNIVLEESPCYVWKRITSVSYTHLDVYKRQVL